MRNRATHLLNPNRGALALLVALGAAGCAGAPPMSTASLPMASFAPLTCPAGSTVREHVLPDGSEVHRCERSEPDAPGGMVAHGPERVVVERRCSDGAHHRLVVERRYVHGLAQGEERALLDGAPAYTTHWTDSDPRAAHFASGVATEFDSTAAGAVRVHDCVGVMVCGDWVGTVRCRGRRGQRLAGDWNGPGAVRDAAGAWLSGTFERGLAEGRVVRRDANGDRFEGQMRDGRRDGDGRTVFAGGGWLVGGYREGELDGRVTVEYATGIRVVTRWRRGTLVQLLRKERTWQEHGEPRREILYAAAGDIVAPGRPGRGRRALLAFSVEERQNGRHVQVYRVFAPMNLRPDRIRAAVAAETGEAPQGLRMLRAPDGFAEAESALREQLHPEAAEVAGEVGVQSVVYFHDRGVVAVQHPKR